MEKIFNQYKWPILIGTAGFILAILFLTVGFLQTMLILILKIAGSVLGFYLQAHGILK
ncbi:MAG: DUF2273 domain-containing protein [Oenococcus oeni]